MNVKKNPWPESASELYRPSDRLLLAKLVQTFAVRVCHVASVTDPCGLILGFLGGMYSYVCKEKSARLSACLQLHYTYS
jgi:hypothetical protein